jgi:transposase-like protein
MPQSHTFDPERLVLSLPTCPRCWALMWLTRIEPDKPGYDNRTFVCASCDYTITETVKYR